MKNSYSLESQIGVFYTQTNPVFDVLKNRVLSTVGNMIKSFSLQDHQANLLPIETSY